MQTLECFRCGHTSGLGQCSSFDQDFKDCGCRQRKSDSIDVPMGMPCPAPSLGKNLTSAVCHLPSQFRHSYLNRSPIYLFLMNSFLLKFILLVGQKQNCDFKKKLHIVKRNNCIDVRQGEHTWKTKPKGLPMMMIHENTIP